MNAPQIGELMTPMPLTVAVTESIRQVKRIMVEKGIRHLPVSEDGELAGIISDRDIKLAQAVSGEAEFDLHCKVGDICLPDPYVVSDDTQAEEVLTHMYKNRIGSALVTHSGQLVGIFTVTDACRAFAKYLKGEPLRT